MLRVRSQSPCWIRVTTPRRDYRRSEQVPESRSQLVVLTPGRAGVAVAVLVAMVVPLQALFGVARVEAVIMLDMLAAT